MESSLKTPVVLSIIIPAYNEEKTIFELVQKVVDARLDSEKATKQIIIVDDGSKDTTIREIERVKAANPAITILFVKQPKNQGKGMAIRKGIELATGEVILIQDADLEYDPKDYAALIEPIIRGHASVVYGSRYLMRAHRKKARERVPAEGLSYLSFVIGGRLITWATNLLYWTHLTDEPTCYKVFRADVLKSMDLHCTGFEFCPEVTAKVARQGIQIVEIPIAFYPRTVKEGKKIKWSDGLKGIGTLIKYRFMQ